MACSSPTTPLAVRELNWLSGKLKGLQPKTYTEKESVDPSSTEATGTSESWVRRMAEIANGGRMWQLKQMATALAAETKLANLAVARGDPTALRAMKELDQLT